MKQEQLLIGWRKTVFNHDYIYMICRIIMLVEAVGAGFFMGLYIGE
jgi:hypothetical protein